MDKWWLILAAALGGCEENATDESPRASVSERLSALGSEGKLRFELELDPELPAVGQMFRVVTTVFDQKTGRPLQRGTLKLDATMPDHGHGMATRPVHRAVGPGRFVSEGMKLHMPGSWLFHVELTSGGVGDRKLEDRVVIQFEQPVAP